jgi:isoleucyl-tRNA synthetase
MRAGLPTREPEALSKWQQEDLYGELMKRNEGKPLYILHDGPPYANGIIHLGTALNKSLKDIERKAVKLEEENELNKLSDNI